MNLIEANDQISLCSDVFQAVTRLKATSMLRASTCFNVAGIVQSTVILLQCLLQK